MNPLSSELPFHIHNWLIISLKDLCFVIRKWLTFFAIYKNLKHDRPHCLWCLQKPLMMCSLYTGAFPGFGRELCRIWPIIYFFKFGNLHVAKRHAAHGEAVRFVRRVRGHAPPRNFFKMVQFGAF